jgi:hypothetical protein
MKKEYITPYLEVIKVQSVTMLASSVPVGDDTGDTDGALGREEQSNTPSRPGIWEQGW